MKYDQVDGLEEGRDGFLGLLDGFSHIDREPWCSRYPRRSLVTTIIRWATVCTATIGGPEWTGVGLHTLQARPVCTALGCYEGYSNGGCGSPYVSGGPSLTALQTAFGHRPIFFD